MKSLDTDSRTIALRRVAPLVATWKGEIEVARTGTKDPIELDLLYWRGALKGADDHAEEGKLSERDHIIDVLQEQAEALDRQTEGSGMEFFKRATGQLIDTTEHLEEWITSLPDTPKTIDMKRSEVEKFAKEFPTLDRIKKKEVKRWCVKLMSEGGLKAKTINKNLSFIRSYWAFLESIEVVGDDYKPLHDLGIKAKKSKADDTVPFNPKDVVALRARAQQDGDVNLTDLIALGMWTGARIEELCSLEISDIVDGTIKIEDAKTPAGWREVPIHSKLRPTLDRLIKGRKNGYILAGLSKNKYDDRSNAIGKRFGRMKSDMGFRPRVEAFHSIRGTVATLLDNAGVPENVAASIIGHDVPTMTYGTYSGGPSIEVKAAALELIDYPEAQPDSI